VTRHNSDILSAPLTGEQGTGATHTEGRHTQHTRCEVDALGVITISRGCFERCCSNKKAPPYHSNLSFVTLRNRRPTLLRASAYRTPSEASPRRRCGHASRFLCESRIPKPQTGLAEVGDPHSTHDRVAHTKRAPSGHCCSSLPLLKWRHDCRRSLRPARG